MSPSPVPEQPALEAAVLPPHCEAARVLPYHTDRKVFCQAEKQHAVCMLGLRLLRGDTGEKLEECQRRTDNFILWLSTVSMTPRLNTEGQVLDTLKLITEGFRFREKLATFPAHNISAAQALLDKFAFENWGSTEVQDDDTPSVELEMKAGPVKGLEVMQVPTGHRIWGKGGIMFGLARHRTGNRIVPNPETKSRDYRHYGDHGLAVGQWFHSQLQAWVFGAHGSPQSGISGNTHSGAYSIVLSEYDGLDKDDGEIVYYSGSGSKTNTDAAKPTSSKQGTQALKASYKTANPIRLFRSFKSGSRFAPKAGFRYDGLYQVVDADYPLNLNGGMYERFKLVRVQDQRPLSDIKTPTARQLEDLKQAHYPYW